MIDGINAEEANGEVDESNMGLSVSKNARLNLFRSSKWRGR